LALAELEPRLPTQKKLSGILAAAPTVGHQHQELPSGTWSVDVLALRQALKLILRPGANSRTVSEEGGFRQF